MGLTTKIYSLIYEGQYEQAIEKILVFEDSLHKYSLLGYCYYQIKDYDKSAQSYKACLALEYKAEYKRYYAFCLYHMGSYEEAKQACMTIDAPELLAACLLYTSPSPRD